MSKSKGNVIDPLKGDLYVTDSLGPMVNLSTQGKTSSYQIN